MPEFNKAELFRFRLTRKNIQDYLTLCENSCNIGCWINYQKKSPIDIAKRIEQHWLNGFAGVDSTLEGNIAKISDPEHSLGHLLITSKRYSIEDGIKNVPYFSIVFGSGNKSVEFKKSISSHFPQILIGEPLFDAETVSNLYMASSGYVELNKRAS